MGGDDEAVGALGFGEASGDGEHDAIAEGDDGLLHGFLFVMPVRDVAAGGEEVRLEVVGHEAEGDGGVVDAEVVAMPLGHGDFPGIVFRAVIEAEAAADMVVAVGEVEGGD